MIVKVILPEGEEGAEVSQASKNELAPANAPTVSAELVRKRRRLSRVFGKKSVMNVSFAYKTRKKGSVAKRGEIR
jgi:hypothetical protein